MKHIQKKFLLEIDSVNFNDKDETLQEIELDTELDQSLLKQKKGSIVFMNTTNNKTVSGFVHNVSGKYCVFPVPDPTLVYFHNAQVSYNDSKRYYKTLVEKLEMKNMKESMPIHELYNYYGATCGIIINLFTAIESFINQHIPKDYVFKKKTYKCDESYSYSQIMDSVNFKIKLTEILPETTKKDFFRKQSSSGQIIWNLKEFRDQIIHTKPEDTNSQYQELMKKSLNFNYDKAIDAVSNLINFYKPNYIVECGCDKDF